MKKNNNSLLILGLTLILLLCLFLDLLIIYFQAPNHQDLDIEMIAMLRELYGDELVRKEYGEAILEECKKVELFRDLPVKKYYPYDYQDANGYVSKDNFKKYLDDRSKGLAVEDINYAGKKKK